MPPMAVSNAATTMNIRMPTPTPQPRMGTRKLQSVRKNMLLRMCGLRRDLRAIVIAEEDVFERWLMGREIRRAVVGGGLHDRAKVSRHDELDRIAVGGGRMHARQIGEVAGRDRRGEGKGYLVLAQIAQRGYRIYPDERALTDDADAVADLLDLWQDVRGEEDGAPVGARLHQELVELDLVQRIEAAAGLVEHEQARLVHERLD